MKAVAYINDTAYWSVAHAAEYLACDRSAIYRWIREGRITAYRIGGTRTTRIKATDAKALFSEVAPR